MIEGTVLMLIGVIAMLAGPASRAFAVTRAPDVSLVAGALRAAFPPPAPRRSLDRLAEAADAAIARDGVAGD